MFWLPILIDFLFCSVFYIFNFKMRCNYLTDQDNREFHETNSSFFLHFFLLDNVFIRFVCIFNYTAIYSLNAQWLHCRVTCCFTFFGAFFFCSKQAVKVSSLCDVYVYTFFCFIRFVSFVIIYCDFKHIE